MTLLNISEEEARQVMEDDKRIDRGEKLFELPPELEAGAKRARRAERKPTAYDFSKRERKKDGEKREIIKALTRATECECEIANPEREFTFTKNSKKYKVVLSCPRS